MEWGVKDEGQFFQIPNLPYPSIVPPNIDKQKIHQQNN